MHSLVVEPELEVKHVNEILLAMLCKHVDDLKIAAPRPIILEIIAFLERVFGKPEAQWYEFTNCGIRRRQNPTTFECELDQVEFIAAIKPIQSVEISGAPADQPLSDVLLSQFFSLLMSLAYALMTRVDLCAHVAALQKVATKDQGDHSTCSSPERTGALGSAQPQVPVLPSPSALPGLPRAGLGQRV